MQLEKYTLLTGVTGMVGRYLLRDLTQAGHRLAVIIRPNGGDIDERAAELIEFWRLREGIELDMPVVIEGDVAQPMLGTSSKDRDWISKNCGQIVHNAALLSFTSGPRDREPWVTNLGGTMNVLEFCKATGIDDLKYVSTAYVSGNRFDRIFEDDLDCGQTFRNDYEQSKFEAEIAVRNCPWLDRPTIFRPSVIVGDSETGYTSSYHGLYLYLRVIDTLVPSQVATNNGKRRTEIDMPMSGDEPRNLIPVDWVSQTLSCLTSDATARGKTFHLTPDRCTTAREIIDSCQAYYDSFGVRYVGRNGKRVATSEFAAKVFESIRIYQDYETTDPVFDKSNVLQHAPNIRCPLIDQPMLTRFLKFGIEDKWGKISSRRRRTRKSEVGAMSVNGR